MYFYEAPVYYIQYTDQFYEYTFISDFEDGKDSWLIVDHCYQDFQSLNKHPPVRLHCSFRKVITPKHHVILHRQDKHTMHAVGSVNVVESQGRTMSEIKEVRPMMHAVNLA